MNQDYPNFQSRVQRIDQSRRNRVVGRLGLIRDAFEAAAYILMPDQVTMWMVGNYDWFAAQIIAWQSAA